MTEGSDRLFVAELSEGDDGLGTKGCIVAVKEGQEGCKFGHGGVRGFVYFCFSRVGVNLKVSFDVDSIGFQLLFIAVWLLRLIH